MKFNVKNIILLLVIVGVMILAVSLFDGFTKKQEELVLSDLYSLFEEDLVKDLNIDEKYLVTGTKLRVKGYIRPTRMESVLPRASSISLPSLIRC